MTPEQIINDAIEQITASELFDYDALTQGEIDAVRMLQRAREWISQ